MHTFNKPATQESRGRGISVSFRAGLQSETLPEKPGMGDLS